MKISKRHTAPKKKVITADVMIENPDITWEKGCLVIRKTNVEDGTFKTSSRHDYQITVTVDEFRQMLRAFTGTGGNN